MEIQEKSRAHKIVCGRLVLEPGRRTYIMGVLNRTPDSFSDGGEYFDEAVALGRAQQMAEEGADIIDIGGESTRPGADPVSVEEELNRVASVIEKASRIVACPISVDTYKHEVAREALRKGASLINDITGLKGDPLMAGVIAQYGAAVVLMHIKGTPKDMQENPFYEDLIGEIIYSLGESIDIALRAGIDPAKIIIDPGIGFGKTAPQNLKILARLGELKALAKPILIGVSRKSFIGSVLGKAANDRLFGTSAACAAAIMNGADILRVHDVTEIRDTARVIDAIKRERNVL
ncbi:MAG: dihydropteroate synthase [Candidatus Omnitrophica bacterium]|nr:dihydropteroate synthase [Candidatus Omnitrophota bacterium]